MNILLASSEIVPFAKTGGLADVAGALPKEIKKLKHDVKVVMPLYKIIDRDKYKLVHKGEYFVPVYLEQKKVDLYQSNIPGTSVPIYFIGNDQYFDRDHLYQEDGADYPDNDERFVFFNRAVMELCKHIDYRPSVIHCNDWQTGLIPVYLKTLYKDDPFFSITATVFTIHNLAYQGLCDPHRAISASQIPWDEFAYDKLEFWGNFSFIKGGLVYSDILNTVSNRYSKEIQTAEYGCGMEGLLSARKGDLYGVVNGIDYSIWDPKKDKKIPGNYGIADMKGKVACKKVLLKEYGLKYKEGVPLIGVISRLADQKGFDLIAEDIESLMEEDIQFVLLGTGDQKYHDLFTKIADKYPGKAGVALKYDAVLAQLIYAGSDMFLMPSRYEPCGLGQLISLKYGTIPVVRETGGLADTIVDFDLADVFEADKANGFVFSEYDAEVMLDKIKRAVHVYGDKVSWSRLVKNAMKSDYSWKASAKQYENYYNMAINNKNT